MVVILEKMVELESEAATTSVAVQEDGDAASFDVKPFKVPSLEGEISYEVLPTLTLSTEAMIKFPFLIS